VIPGLAPRWVAPFGHLGLSVCVRLPRAFRSLPRPSSPSCAQASPTRLRSLDHNSLTSSRARAIYFAQHRDMASPCAARQRVNCFYRRRGHRPAVDRETVSRVLIHRIASRTRCALCRLTTTFETHSGAGYPTITTSIRCQTAHYQPSNHHEQPSARQTLGVRDGNIENRA
jgi:hypothetical protein